MVHLARDRLRRTNSGVDLPVVPRPQRAARRSLAAARLAPHALRCSGEVRNHVERAALSVGRRASYARGLKGHARRAVTKRRADIRGVDAPGSHDSDVGAVEVGRARFGQSCEEEHR